MELKIKSCTQKAKRNAICNTILKFDFLINIRTMSSNNSAVQPKLHLVIPFGDSKEAEIAYNSLSVDREPQRSQVSKTLSVNNNQLILDLEGPDARSLRLSSNTFFDHLTLVQKTIDKFSLDKFNSPQPLPKKPCIKS